jgi:multidrug efflux pump subunit AcrA (membrane-fusion protein)
MRPVRPALALALVAGSLALSACAEVAEYESTYQPVQIAPVKGSDIQRVTLTAEAARRIGLETRRVRRSGRLEVIPYSALVYGDAGETFTIVNPRPLHFVRTPIRVDRIAGDDVFVSQGPAVGTAVVSTGVAEIYSAEFEVTE